MGDPAYLVYDAERLLSVGICADGQDDAAVMIADQLAELAFRHIFRGIGAPTVPTYEMMEVISGMALS